MDYSDYEFYDTLSASKKHFGCKLPNHQLQTVAAAEVSQIDEIALVFRENGIAVLQVAVDGGVFVGLFPYLRHPQDGWHRKRLDNHSRFSRIFAKFVRLNEFCMDESQNIEYKAIWTIR